MSNILYTLNGICDCGERVERQYSENIIKGLQLCSDDYRLNMKCTCDYSKVSGGNVKRHTVFFKKNLREEKIKKLLDGRITS